MVSDLIDGLDCILKRTATVYTYGGEWTGTPGEAWRTIYDVRKNLSNEIDMSHAERGFYLPPIVAIASGVQPHEMDAPPTLSLLSWPPATVSTKIHGTVASL